mmetsp:Transcript_7719/g.25598  ORF Transcript_7719/g.25598 Transcript_7719/m.25598 type:complete len:255 (-) Transcript_7719:17-781(-)
MRACHRPAALLKLTPWYDFTLVAVVVAVVVAATAVAVDSCAACASSSAATRASSNCRARRSSFCFSSSWSRRRPASHALLNRPSTSSLPPCVYRAVHAGAGSATGLNADRVVFPQALPNPSSAAAASHAAHASSCDAYANRRVFAAETSSSSALPRFRPASPTSASATAPPGPAAGAAELRGFFGSSSLPRFRPSDSSSDPRVSNTPSSASLSSASKSSYSSPATSLSQSSGSSALPQRRPLAWLRCRTKLAMV